MMDKKSYLDALSTALDHLDDEERNEIVSDYDSHFDSAYEDGLDDEAIILSLGEPLQLAQKYVTKTQEVVDETTLEAQAENQVVEEAPVQVLASSSQGEADQSTNEQQQQVPYNSQPRPVQSSGRSPLGALVIAGLLIFMNLTFVLGPFIAVWGVWFGGIVTGVAVVAEGIKMIVLTSTVNSYSVGLSEITVIAQIGFYLSFGGCVTLLMVKAAKGLGILTKKYVLWNVKMVKGES